MRLATAVRRFLSGYFSTRELSDKTYRAYECDLRQFVSFWGARRSLESITADTVEQWAAHLKGEDYAPASMRRKLVALRVFLHYWVRRNVLPESPFWRVRLRFGAIEQLPRTLTRREIKRLLEAARRCFEDAAHSNGERLGPSFLALRNMALINLLFATGIRVGEAASLTLESYSAEERSFRLRGKGRRYRMAYVVDQAAVDILRNYVAERRQIPTDSPAFFLNTLGTRLSTQGMTDVVRRLAERSGIKRPVTPHMLRHTVATLLLHNGVDIRVVQEFLGHRSIATTQRYTHVSRQHLVATLRKRHPSLALRSVSPF